MFVALKKNCDLELTPENDDEKRFLEFFAETVRDGGSLRVVNSANEFLEIGFAGDVHINPPTPRTCPVCGPACKCVIP